MIFNVLSLWSLLWFALLIFDVVCRYSDVKTNKRVWFASMCGSILVLNIIAWLAFGITELGKVII